MARHLQSLTCSLSGHAMDVSPHAATEPGRAAKLPTPAAADQGRPVSFSDVLHTLNPLQYLPVVGTIYRAVTGDDVHPAFRVAASAALSVVLGGPIGLAVTMISVAAEEIAHGGPASSAIAQRTAMAAHAYGRTGRMA
jgi:hypothetical protein